jgi:hypothetical protein
MGTSSHAAQIFYSFKKIREKKKKEQNICSFFFFSQYRIYTIFPAYIQAGIGNHPVARFEPIKPKIQKLKMGKT